jgi:hypothetical protein
MRSRFQIDVIVDHDEKVTVADIQHGLTAHLEGETVVRELSGRGSAVIDHVTQVGRLGDE